MIDNAVETNCDALRTMFILQQPSTVILLTVVAFREGCPFQAKDVSFSEKPAACTGSTHTGYLQPIRRRRSFL
jgi:hypothetical protein